MAPRDHEYASRIVRFSGITIALHPILRAFDIRFRQNTSYSRVHRYHKIETTILYEYKQRPFVCRENRTIVAQCDSVECVFAVKIGYYRIKLI